MSILLLLLLLLMLLSQCLAGCCAAVQLKELAELREMRAAAKNRNAVACQLHQR